MPAAEPVHVAPTAQSLFQYTVRFGPLSVRYSIGLDVLNGRQELSRGIGLFRGLVPVASLKNQRPRYGTGAVTTEHRRTWSGPTHK